MDKTEDLEDTRIRSVGMRTISPRMSLLLVACLLLLAYILQEVESTVPAIDFMFVFLILAIVYVAGASRRWLLVGILLGIPTIILSFASEQDTWPPNPISIIFFASVAIFVGFGIMVVIREVLLSDRVTVHTISGALTVYLLVGILWAILYLLVEGLEQDSFSIPVGIVDGGEPGTDLFSSLTYFSLITLTSTGYGDILPVTDVARSLAALEAMTGQFFLAVLVAWLMGKYLAHSLE